MGVMLSNSTSQVVRFPTKEHACISRQTFHTNSQKYERFVKVIRKEGNGLLNEHSTHFRLYVVRHMVKFHSDSERGNPLPLLHEILFSISSKGAFICIITQTGYHIPRPLLHQSWSTGWVHQKDRSDDPSRSL